MTQIGPVAEGTATSVETSSSDPRREASDQTVVIVAGADDKFALGLTVALFSAVRCLDPLRDAHVFVLDGGLQPQQSRPLPGCTGLSTSGHRGNCRGQ